MRQQRVGHGRHFEGHFRCTDSLQRTRYSVAILELLEKPSVGMFDKELLYREILIVIMLDYKKGVDLRHPATPQASRRRVPFKGRLRTEPRLKPMSIEKRTRSVEEAH